VKASLGRRTEITIGVVVLIVAAAALIYAANAQGGETYGSPTAAQGVSTISAPGYSCGDPRIPPVVQRVENSSQFVQLSQGNCYNYMGASYGGDQGSSVPEYTFNYYDGTVFYPCGTFPAELVTSQIQVAVPGNGTISSGSTFQFNNDTSMLNVYNGCGPNLPPVGVVSADTIIITVPALQELNITLSTASSPSAITSLTAVLITPGANDTIAFTGITPSTPAKPGSTVSHTHLMGVPVTVITGGIYSMSIQGSYSNGQSFSYVVQVVLVNT
jgi:hypothetical protein